MSKRIVMVMGVQRSGTTALFEALSFGGTVGFAESPDDYIYDNFYLRPERELRSFFHEIPGAILLQPISETFRRSVRDVFEEYAAYDLHIVWIYRDPVNATHSIQLFDSTVRMTGVPELAEQWNRRNRSVLDALPVYSDRITIVRYEDLVESPSLLAALGARLGIEAAPLFRADSRGGRRNMAPELQSLVDSATRETRARLDAARTVLRTASAPSQFTSGRDISSPEFRADPFRHLREWRQRAAVHRLSQPNSWLVLNYADVSSVLGDSQRFSRLHYAAKCLLLGFENPARDARLRRLLEPYFTPQAMRLQAARIERHTRGILAELAGDGEFDLVSSFALRLFRELSADRHTLLALLAADAQLTPEEVADFGRFIPLVEYALVNFIGNTFHYLFLHPEQDAVLRSHPSDITAFANEVLRLYAPAFTMRRFTLCPVEIAGECIPAHANIYLAIAAANRDPVQYPQPDEIVLRRDGHPHLSLGVGLREYLGRRLLEAACETVLRVMLTEFPPLRPAVPPGEIRFIGVPELYGPAALAVRF